MKIKQIVKAIKIQKVSLLLMAIICLNSSTNGQAIGPGTAPVLFPTGGFAIDGNGQANTPLAGIGDWVAGPAGSGGYVLDNTGNPINPGVTVHLVDAYNTNDNNFSSGQKANSNPNTWTWINGSANDKTDINNAIMHFSTDANGHQWLMVAADRLSNSGSAYLSFEFLQGTLTSNANGTFTSAGPHDGRTVGDFSLTFFSSGSDFILETWKASGSSYNYFTSPAPANAVYGASNASAVPAPYGAFGNSTYPIGTFTEGAVDLTNLLGSINSCTQLNIKTILVKSKTSASVSANITDFVTPIQVSLTLGVANAGKDEVKCSQGVSTAFNLTGGAAVVTGDTVKTTTWSVVGGAATITSPTSLATAVQVTTSPATLRLTITTKNGCSVFDDIVLTVNAAPTSSVSGPGTVCSNNPVVLAATTNEANPKYLWSPGGQTTSTISVSNASTTTYSVIVTGANGCSTTSAGKVVTVNPVPVVSLNPLNLCEGAYGDLCATSSGSNLSYAWSNGITDQCFIVTTPNTYSVVVTDGNNCSASASRTVNYVNPPTLVVSKSGPTTFCNGDSVILTASGASSYVWNTGATTAAIKVKSQGLYTVTGSDQGCEISVLVYVTVYASPTVSITASGNTTFCQGGSVQLTANGAGTYLWNNSLTGNQINVNASGTYSVIGTDGNGCKASASKVVTVNPLPIVSFVGPLIICKSSSAFALTSGSPAGGTYSGSGVSNGMFNPAIGVGSYLITYTYTNENGCTSSATGTINVTDVTPSPGAISGPVLAVCANTSHTYSIAAVAGATSYTWTAPANATISNGQGTSSVTVSFNGNFISGIISVKANSACGASSSSIAIISSLPATPTIFGNATPCRKGINKYWVSPVAGATSYSWTVPAGSSIVSGQGTDTIVVNVGNKSGDVTVYATNACGNSSSASKAINVNCREADSNSFSITAEDNSLVMTVYPNPAHNHINVLFISDNENQYLLRIFDMTGRMVFNQVKKAEVGDNIISLNIDLAKGIYIVSLTSGELNKQSKIIVE